MRRVSEQELDRIAAEFRRADLTVHVGLDLGVERSVDIGDRNARTGVVVADRTDLVGVVNAVYLVVRDHRIRVGVRLAHLGADGENRVALADELVARDHKSVFAVREAVAGSGTALRLDVRREAAFPNAARFAKALTGIPHDVIGNLEIANITAVPRRAIREKILDGIVAVFDHIVVIIDIELICRVVGIGFVLAAVLLGNARVVDLIDIVVLHAEIVAAAVNFNGVAVAQIIRDGCRSDDRIFDSIGDGSADPAKFAVLHENVL